MNSKIAIYTRAYNTKPYLRQCIESVLSQTYTDFIYIIVDNGCTDGSSEIINEYAERDNRIRRVRFEQNGSISTREMIDKYSDADCDYITILDSDDWWEPDYLERLLKLAADNNADIVSTGTLMHIEENGLTSERRFNRRFIMTPQNYVELFPMYHVHFRVVWGKLVRRELYMNTEFASAKELGFSYGGDTLNAFALLRKAKKVCLDDSVLHHYRINKKSVSHKYNPGQSLSDIYLFNDALDFLSPYGPISENNLLFLHVVYSNAVNDTLNNIRNSTLTASEKSEEYYKILERQVTKDCYKRTHKDIINNKARLFAEVFKAFSEHEEIPQKWNEILSFYFPKCHGAISTRSAKLVLMETDLLRGFIDDDSISVIKTLCLLIARNQYTKQFDLPEILRCLSQNQPVISNITDPKFFKKHGDIYLLLYQNKYADALSAMTDTLLKEKVNNETFLQTYLNVAALLEQVDEFIFGKIRTADFYLSGKRFEECKEILDDLGEMGVEDNEEIRDMKAKLSEQLS